MRSGLQEQVAHELASRFEAVGIRYAVVHGLEHYPAFPHRDLDLLVHDHQVERAVDEAQRHFESRQLRFVAQRRINGSCWCFVAARGAGAVCEFDLIPRLRWGPAILVNGPHPLSTIGIFRVDPWASFVKRVLIQLLGGNIAKLATRLDELALSDAERQHVPEMLAGYLGKQLAGTLINTIDGRDIRSFDLWGVWSYDGKDALTGMVGEWFGSLPDDETVVVRFDEIRTEAGADVAAVSAFTTFAAETPDGTELRSMNNRLTWILRREGDGWKIVHEHTSAPAGDDGKVSLRRA